MTREEARKLLSGYATGSLTELERQLLFDAALEDQELFDELADEQSLKELIDLPGAKQRLIAALEPERKRAVWWPWAAGVAAAAAITIAVWVTRPQAPPVQIAENKIAAPAEPTPAAAPEPVPQAEAPKPVAPKAAPPPLVAAEKMVAAKKTVAQERADTNVVRDELRQQTAEVEDPALTLRTGVGGAPPTPQGFLANVPLVRPNAIVTGGDALKYEVTDTGILRIVPIQAGVLQVLAGTSPLFARNPVVAATPIELSIPLEATQLTIDFSLAANAPPATVLPSTEVSGTLVLSTGANPRTAISIPARK